MFYVCIVCLCPKNGTSWLIMGKVYIYGGMGRQPYNGSHVMRKPDFAIAKTKTQFSFVVIAKLISAFVFATRIEQSLFFQNPKFQAASHLMWLYSSVCVGPGRKPRRPVFSQRGSWVKYTFMEEWDAWAYNG